MRDPVRSEADAFHIAIGCALLIGASLALGSLLEPLVGVALFAGAVIGVVIWEVTTKDADRSRPLRADGSGTPPPRHRRGTQRWPRACWWWRTACSTARSCAPRFTAAPAPGPSSTS